MDEREFAARADAMLAHIERTLDACDGDFDYETLPGGVIELEFSGDGGKIVINRHGAAREIWIAAKSGGYHFRPDDADPLLWLGTRDGVELLSRLARCIGEQSGGTLQFTG